MPFLFLFANTRKAFACVDFFFLLMILQLKCLNPNMLSRIMVLAHSQGMKKMVPPSLLSPYIMIQDRDTHSPSLFVISLEPFLATVRGNTDIKGVKLRNTKHKLAFITWKHQFHQQSLLSNFKLVPLSLRYLFGQSPLTEKTD